MVLRLFLQHSKAKTQIQALSSRHKQEQKRNEESTNQLRRTMDVMNKIMASCDGLSASVMNLESDKAFLEKKLQIQITETQSANAMLSQTKNELMNAYNEKSNLEQCYRREQQRLHMLEVQNSSLAQEVSFSQFFVQN